jgi:hypothetical protein
VLSSPSGILLLGTALARAGVLSTKSGTWTREAITRAMPGVVLGHGASNRLHEEALRKFGLVDENGPTWFTEGRPDALKMFKTTGERMQGMSPQDRARYGRAAFGTQGAGAVAVLSDPQVQDQIRNLDKLRSSPEFLDSYRNFSGNYQAGSTMQDARTAVAQFNVTMGELARMTLPAVNVALGGFKGVLEGLRGVIPGGGGTGSAVIGGHAILGAAAGAGTGALVGALGGPVGLAGGDRHWRRAWRRRRFHGRLHEGAGRKARQENDRRIHKRFAARHGSSPGRAATESDAGADLTQLEC